VERFLESMLGEEGANLTLKAAAVVFDDYALGRLERTHRAL
jgi:hypothetical protein